VCIYAHPPLVGCLERSVWEGEGGGRDTISSSPPLPFARTRVDRVRLDLVEREGGHDYVRAFYLVPPPLVRERGNVDEFYGRFVPILLSIVRTPSICGGDLG